MLIRKSILKANTHRYSLDQSSAMGSIEWLLLPSIFAMLGLKTKRIHSKTFTRP